MILDVWVINLLFNGLFGMIMFFFKADRDNIKESLKEAEKDIKNIKDNYTKKEDFREFKDELFVRLDEMKLDFKQAIDRLHK